MKEFKIKVTNLRQIQNMAKSLIEKFSVEGLKPEEVSSVKFYYEKEEE